MFENSGTTCKIYARVFFCLGVIGSILTAIGIGLLIGSFLAFFGIIIAGLITAFLSALPLYTLGEVYESNKEMRKMIESLQKPVEKINSEKVVAKPEVNVEPVKVENSISVNKDGGWKCSCGREQPSFVSTCVCGTSKWDSLKKD